MIPGKEKHIQKTTDLSGKHNMNEDLKQSQWAHTATTATVSCPRCGAEPGVNCHTPKFRRVFIPHTERCKSYRDYVGTEEFNRRHSYNND
jgi:hypothetical protein